MNKLFLCEALIKETVEPIAIVCAKTREHANMIILKEINEKYNGIQVNLNFTTLGFALNTVRIGFVVNNIL
jgi:hypothetical protein